MHTQSGSPPPFFCLFKPPQFAQHSTICLKLRNFKPSANHWDLKNLANVLPNFRANKFGTVFFATPQPFVTPMHCNVCHPPHQRTGVGVRNATASKNSRFTSTRIAFGLDDSFPRAHHTMSTVHQLVLLAAGTRRKGC